ncbi:hypothetical protein RND81_03G167600 [Saponaria officinalis]|uniref:Uncharacterized protein n=1 Tax=Saponaria officinalis TaxID=3572 RepID=A0AAW1M8C0_SAPOF
MRVNVAQSPPPSPSSSISHLSSQNTLPSSLHLHRSFSSSLSLSSKSTAHNHLRRSFSASFDGHDFPKFPNDHFTPKYKHPPPKPTSFLGHVEVLEPSLLGIRPDPPEWPARDAVIRECIARRASCVDIPLSMRMIAMKQKFLKLEEVREIEIGDLGFDEVDNENNPMNNLCCSTLFIIREIQNYALKNRGIVSNEELDEVIVSRIQREMTSSFVWLFKEVFAKTPDFMVQIMVLTSDFGLHSLQSFNLESSHLGGNLGNLNVGHLELANSRVPIEEILEESEVSLWSCVVEEVDDIRGDQGRNRGVGFVVVDNADEKTELFVPQKKFEFVSPVKVEIERDDYEEYHRTDLFYQIGLLHEPNNTLLLSNYAQFLCLVSRDYDRAEECYKRAIQLDRTDAEVASLYANFLWVIRKDLWGAEERFQQAVAAEPDNSYHASKYASFLWSTGGDETCYPIDSPNGKS